MKRKFYDKLKQWEEKNTKEPLMIVGARQVGKTYIIKKFCEDTYEDFVYFNFEETPDINTVFEGSLKSEDILEQLSILEGRKIDEKTTIVFDEIQRCEKAITSLKYFCESHYNYRVIVAGSLLGVKINRFEGSFPVGKTCIEHMYSMDFEEFLVAIGEDMLCEAIKKAYKKVTPLSEAIHKKALRLYQDYLIVGGMPACVKEYINNGKTLVELNRDIQSNLLLSYQADMSKYTISGAESLKIIDCFESIPRQLARDNPKFKYKEIRSNANKRDFYSSVDWLKASGMIIKINNLDFIQSPLKGYMNESNFRVYLSDIGLLSKLAGLSYRDILNTENNIYKGMLAENYVLQMLREKDVEVYYYKPDATMEIDAVIERGGEIIPIEIKAGRHKKSTSLKNYNAKFNPSKMIRISENNFGRVDNLVSVPLYAAFCL